MPQFRTCRNAKPPRDVTIFSPRSDHRGWEDLAEHGHVEDEYLISGKAAADNRTAVVRTPDVPSRRACSPGGRPSRGR
jgi:hypothetical protein